MLAVVRERRMYLPEGKIRMLEVQVFGIPSIGLLQSLLATGDSAALRAQQGAQNVFERYLHIIRLRELVRPGPSRAHETAF